MTRNKEPIFWPNSLSKTENKIGGSGNIVHRTPTKNKNCLSPNRNPPIKASVSFGTIVHGEKTVPVCPVTQLGQTCCSIISINLVLKIICDEQILSTTQFSTSTKLLTLLCRSSGIQWSLLQCPAQMKGCVALHFYALTYSIELSLAQSSFHLVHRLWCC